MFRFFICRTGTILSLLLVASAPVQSQPSLQSQPPLRVATRIIPPFVIQDNEKLTGFSINLWQSITQELGISSKLSVYPTITDILSAVKSDRADLGIAAISITAQRERDFDFSQPMFESGLQILVRSQSTMGSIPANLLSLIVSPTFLQAAGIFLLLIFIPAHIVWFFERHSKDGFIPTKGYFSGILKAYWWALSTLAAQADEMPKGVMGRIVATIWMFTSAVFIAYFTAAVTTSLTVQQLSGTIKGPDDLPGKRVATISGSTSAAYLQKSNIQALEVEQISQAYEDLLKGKIEAVVFDSPVLLYYAANEGKGKVEVVGPIFQKENYGILLSINSPFRKPINNAILRLQEKGIYQALYTKWFSTK
jgi:polar amino acid transport system substrate-binding protein